MISLRGTSFEKKGGAVEVEVAGMLAVDPVAEALILRAQRDAETAILALENPEVAAESIKSPSSSFSLSAPAASPSDRAG